MNGKNIITNISLEQYNKRYKVRPYRLLKYTKKEVEEFDKKNKTPSKSLLYGRRWALIKDTYYEIPKPIRFTWFRNLNVAAQAGICLLGAGVIATAVTVPTVLLNNKTVEAKEDEGGIVFEESDDAKEYFEPFDFKLNSEGELVSKIALKDGKTLNEDDEFDVYLNDKKLIKDTDYTYDKGTKELKINKSVVTGKKHKIKIDLRKAKEDPEKFRLEATNNEIIPDEQPKQGFEITIAGEAKMSKDITWKSSDEKIAKVIDGHVFVPSSSEGGDVVITAKGKDDKGNIYLASYPLNIVLDEQRIEYTTKEDISKFQKDVANISSKYQAVAKKEGFVGKEGLYNFCDLLIYGNKKIKSSLITENSGTINYEITTSKSIESYGGGLYGVTEIYAKLLNYLQHVLRTGDIQENYYVYKSNNVHEYSISIKNKTTIKVFGFRIRTDGHVTDLYSTNFIEQGVLINNYTVGIGNTRIVYPSK